MKPNYRRGIQISLRVLALRLRWPPALFLPAPYDHYAALIIGFLVFALGAKFQYVLREINRELEREIRRKTVRHIVNYVKSNLNGKEE